MEEVLPALSAVVAGGVIEVDCGGLLSCVFRVVSS